MLKKEQRISVLNMSSDEFRKIGHRLIDQVADYLGTIPNRPVTTGETPTEIKSLLGQRSLPENGSDAGHLLIETASMLIDHSLFNGHPRFWGYITSSAAPIGILAELLAAAINPNVGAWSLSPVASEIEQQSIQWIAEMVGFPSDCGGVLVTGGNMANFVGFLAARYAKSRKKSVYDLRSLRLYASEETHTWIHKAVDMYGLGKESVRWIRTDSHRKIDLEILRNSIQNDLKEGLNPFLVIGTAGSVSTGD